MGRLTIGLRALVLLRRIAIAAEGIEKELRYANERAFPPLSEKKRDVKRTGVIISGTPKPERDDAA